ncbi:MAG: EamA family transporter [Patescibacteria group bacterium]
MAWLYIAVIAYFVNASVFVIDKYLLSTKIPRPFAYAFWTAILSSFVFVLVPVIDLPDFGFFVLSFVSGAAFFLGNVFIFKTVKLSDASIAATKVGALTAIFTYVFSLLILKEVFLLSNFFAIAFLILGILFLGKIRKGIMAHALISGIFFGLSLVLLKLAFTEAGFLNGFFWTRIGFIGAALISLVSDRAREEISLSFRQAPAKSKFIFVFNKILAGIGFITLYLAILLGNVSLTNALLGVEFVFIFFLTLFLRNKIPAIAENLKREVLAYKLFGIAFVVVGFLMILAK